MDKPGEAGFGWKLELAEGSKNKCTVVEGRTPANRAIRIYNDELGTSYISQKFAVQPWRWYVAELWVNSEGMYALDFAPKVLASRWSSCTKKSKRLPTA